MEELFNRIKLQRELGEHEGHALFRSLLKLRNSYLIYSKNYFELSSELSNYRINGDLRFNDAYRWRKQKKLIRAIHNLLFSAQSYFEHIEKNSYSHISPDFEKLKIRETDALKENALFHFIRALRNFLTHHQTYPLLLRGDGIISEEGQKTFLLYQSLKTEEFETYLNEKIAKNRKLHHDKMALSYLKELPEKINFESLLSNYHDMIDDFNRLIIVAFIRENIEIFKDFENRVSGMHNDFNSAKPINQLQSRYLRILIMKAER